MITARIKGGLGNQMFQYAAGYALAKRLGQKLKLDTSFYSGQTLRSYKLSYLAVECGDLRKKEPAGVRLLKKKYVNKTLRVLNAGVIPYGRQSVYLLETRPEMVPQYFTIDKQNIYIDGYYQSEKYFSEYRRELSEQFRPGYEQQKPFYRALDEIHSCNSVAVHVRRGDYLKIQYDRNPRHYLLGKRYYMNALSYLEKRLNHPKFFWFSDDIDWVLQEFGNRKDFTFIKMKTEHGDIDELMLMKSCRHIITANSTFSWWASWLNEQENAVHICPAKRFGNSQMFPEHWVRLE